MIALPQKRYRIIYADPPWDYRDKAHAGRRGACYKYPIPPLEWLRSLPVGQLAERDCALFLWVTMPMLPQGLELMRAWGFTYKTVAFTWVKRNRRANTWFWGMGNWTRANPELCLLGIRGRMRRISCSVHSVVEAPVQAHSQKPGIVRQRIVDLLGDLPRIELFARQRVPGWDVWGNELPPEETASP